jgi:hypothetical protein
MRSNFDVLTHTDSAGAYGVALILYTGPQATPYLSWEILSYVGSHASLVAGAHRLLGNLQNGMGGVIGRFVASGECTVMHNTVPDLADEREATYIGCSRLERKRWESKLKEIVEEDEE